MLKARALPPQDCHRLLSLNRAGFPGGSDHPSQWTAITSIAEKIGCAAETLRHWVRQAERDHGRRPRLDDGRTDAVQAA